MKYGFGIWLMPDTMLKFIYIHREFESVGNNETTRGTIAEKRCDRILENYCSEACKEKKRILWESETGQRTSRKARAEQGHRAQRRTSQRSHGKFKTFEKASFRAVVVGEPDCSELWIKWGKTHELEVKYLEITEKNRLTRTQKPSQP